eukprot:CAMPEP_0117450716 /NCGR_PEP_ID=MMETSP0759-20121206/8618_1 /TAXON_ID=63605 /ORGANISM="Percolomonas cosmopolitus, Strain WS" /LENGTH=217 /DNA_ID=CAMNT_0005243259 /DNA_START=40 /DNA_END=693 /DNA_ORIENTATION=-
MPMGNSDSTSQQGPHLTFIVKYRNHRSTLSLPLNATILQLKTEISKLSEEHPEPDAQRIIGLLLNLRRELKDDALLSECDALKEGRKNLIQVLKIKSKSDRERDQQREMQQQLNASGGGFPPKPLTPQQMAENKFIRTREVLQQSMDHLANYKKLCPEQEKQHKFLKQIDEVLLKQMLHLDALEICNQDEQYRVRRKQLLKEIQQLQSALDMEMAKL